MKQWTKDNDGVWRVHYESPEELIRCAFALGTGITERSIALADLLQTRVKEWCNQTTEQVQTAVLDHAPDRLVMAVDDIRHKLARVANVGTRRQVVRRLDLGDEIDADLWGRRDPQCWSEVRRMPQPRRVFRIGCNVGLHNKCKPEHLIYRGAAAAALSDAMSAAGYSVEIVCFSCNVRIWQAKPEDRAVMSIVLKRSDMPLDISQVAYCLGEIGFFRRAVFCARVRASKLVIRPDLGITAMIPDRDRDGFDAIFDADILSYEAAAEALDRYVGRVEKREVNCA